MVASVGERSFGHCTICSQLGPLNLVVTKKFG